MPDVEALSEDDRRHGQEDQQGAQLEHGWAWASGSIGDFKLRTEAIIRSHLY